MMLNRLRDEGPVVAKTLRAYEVSVSYSVRFERVVPVSSNQRPWMEMLAWTLASQVAAVSQRALIGG